MCCTLDASIFIAVASVGVKVQTMRSLLVLFAVYVYCMNTIEEQRFRQRKAILQNVHFTSFNVHELTIFMDGTSRENVKLAKEILDLQLDKQLMEFVMARGEKLHMYKYYSILFGTSLEDELNAFHQLYTCTDEELRIVLIDKHVGSIGTRDQLEFNVIITWTLEILMTYYTIDSTQLCTSVNGMSNIHKIALEQYSLPATVVYQLIHHSLDCITRDIATLFISKNYTEDNKLALQRLINTIELINS